MLRICLRSLWSAFFILACDTLIKLFFLILLIKNLVIKLCLQVRNHVVAKIHESLMQVIILINTLLFILVYQNSILIWIFAWVFLIYSYIFLGLFYLFAFAVSDAKDSWLIISFWWLVICLILSKYWLSLR